MRNSDAYLAQLQALLPPGRAWPREPDAVLTKLLHAFADALAPMPAGDGAGHVHDPYGTRFYQRFRRALARGVVQRSPARPRASGLFAAAFLGHHF